MLADIRRLIEQYHLWLKQKTSLREVEGWVEITTPHLDRHNDHLQIFARLIDDQIELTDDGYTIRDLEISGCALDSPHRKELLNTTLRGFGVELTSDKQLKVKSGKDDFSRRKHSLVQAMLSVNDLFYVSQTHIANLFKEDVAAWMDASEIRYTPGIKFAGKSGFDHLFDFVIPANRKENVPERVVQAITRPSRDAAGSFIYSWLDSHESRPSSSSAYVILNDTDTAVPTGVAEAFRNYSVTAVQWSRRNDVAEKLAA